MASGILGSKSFTYPALDVYRPQIRVLCVKDPSADSGVDSSPVRCHFEIIDLPDNGKDVLFYEAVSYCWGTDTERRDIEIDGQVLSVPINTAKALSWLCHHHGHRRVWIDAVCINQQDLAEKNQQVARMRWVYFYAKRVLIWLGNGQHGGDRPLDRINDSASSVKPVLADNWNRAEAQSDLADYINLSQIIGKVDKHIDWAAVRELLSIEWFRRVWVMQEAWLAQEAVYYHGASTAAWEDVALMNMLLTAKAQKTAPSARSGFFHCIICPRETQAEGESLRLLLTSSNGLLYSHPHDGVFALLGLRRPEHQLPNSPSFVTVNYSRPVAEVYAEATRACIVEEGTLLCLDAIVERPSDLDGRPDSSGHSSWALPLGGDRKAPITLDPLRSFANANTSMVINETADVFSLELQGVIADRIAHVIRRPTLPCSSRDPVVEARFPWIRQLMDAMDIAQHYLMSSKKLLPAWEESHSTNLFADLWSMDRTVHQRFSDNVMTDAFRTRWRELFTNLLSSKSLLTVIAFLSGGASDPESTVSIIQEVAKCVAVVELLSLRYDLFVTETGQLGIGPNRMREGDEVCIIFGEGLPALLRPCGETWAWVGSGYVNELSEVSIRPRFI